MNTLASAFERATAVDPLGDGAWSATCDAAWPTQIGRQRRLYRRDPAARDDRRARRPHARGAIADLPLPAAAEHGGAPHRVTVERQGRTTSTATARLTQGGRLCVIAIAAIADEPVLAVFRADPR